VGNFKLLNLNAGALQTALNYIICLNGIFPQRQ
jgi:microcystin-dependent protein